MFTLENDYMKLTVVGHEPWNSFAANLRVTSNKTTEVVENLLDEFDLVILNAGEMTRFDLGRWMFSPFDLPMISPSLASKCNWDVFRVDALCSDHFPVFTQIQVSKFHDGNLKMQTGPIFLLSVSNILLVNSKTKKCFKWQHHFTS